MPHAEDLYDETYYRCHCGPDPYERTPAWLGFFGNVADEVVRSLQPRSVLDAGCAWGFLVEAFWDRGVEAKGIDVSSYAIEQVRRDMRAFCHVGSLTEPIEGRYDLVTCIEVLEHMPPEEAEQAIDNLTRITDTILFSSSPTDLTEETHFNVRPTISWLKLFAARGFWPDLTYDASFLVSHAILFRRRPEPLPEDALILYSEKIRLRGAMVEQGRQVAALKGAADRAGLLEGQLRDQAAQVEAAQAAAAQARAEADAARVQGDRLREEVLAAKVKAGQAHAERLRLQFEAERVQAEAEAARAESARLQGEAAQARAETDRLRNEGDRLRDEVLQAKTKAAQAHAEGLRVRLEADRVQAEAAAARAAAAQARAEADAARVQADQLRDEVLQAKVKAGQAHAERVRLQLQAEQVRAGAAQAEGAPFQGEAAQARAETDRLRNEAAQARIEADRLRNEDARLRAEIGHLRAEAEVARAERERLTVAFDAVQQERDAVVTSTTWRLSRPARSVSAMIPRRLKPWLLTPLSALRPLRGEHEQIAPPEQTAASSQNPPSTPEAALLAASDLFDRDWYLATYPDVAEAGVDPVLHYLEQGAAEGRDPGPGFSTRQYLALHPDVAEAGLNPLAHYLGHGRAEGRSLTPPPAAPGGTSQPEPDAPAPEQTTPFAREAALLASSDLFDRDWYLRTYSDVAAAGLDPVLHYLEQGAKEGRDPGPRFNTRQYLALHPDVVQAGLNPLVHYLEHGRQEGRSLTPPAASADVPAPEPEEPAPEQTPPFAREAELLASSDLFDRDWYLTTYPDVAESGLDPVLHYLEQGVAEGRDPGPGFSTSFYLNRYTAVAEAGLNPLVHYLEHGRADKLDTAPSSLAVESMPVVRSVAQVLERGFPALQPLPVFRLPNAARRLVMVTDSINAGSLYGGVGTALILSALLARRLGIPLCIATRTEPAEQDNLSKVLRIQNIPLPGNVEFVHAGVGGGDRVGVGDGDLFLTTSWWTTCSTLRSVPADRVLYLIQEDERMFYPHGDDHLRCCETISDPRIRYVVNSRLLYDHFATSGLEIISERGVWFEPSFPETNYHLEEREGEDKLNFLFYARPNNVRNLYYRGLEVIDEAIARGVLDPEEWTFSFVGKDLEEITLAGGVKPALLQNMEWAEYAALIRRSDLGLSLMYTPHPSYPPLDIAASGGVAVTNRFGNKVSLDRYSRNILCENQDVASLVDGLARGAALARNRAERRRNYENQGLGRDWQASFAPVLDHIVGD